MEEETGLQTTDEETDLTSFGDLTPAQTLPRDADPNDLAGTEDIRQDEIKLPRLAIAQGLSDQVTPGNSKHIEGLKLFDMFNDVTNEIYGSGPLRVVPVRRLVKWIEYDPENRGVPLDVDVPIGDPRTKWTKDENKKGIPPKATEYVEFVCMLLHKGRAPEPIVCSIKTTNKFNRNAATMWTSYVAIRGAAIYRGLYDVTSKPEKNDSGTFGVYIVKNAGFVPTSSVVNGQVVPNKAGLMLLEMAKNFHESLEGKRLVVDRDVVTPDEDTSFDTEKMDAQAARAQAQAQTDM